MSSCGTFLQFVAAQLQDRKHFELVQSYMHLFLTVHGEMQDSDGCAELKLDSH